MRSFIAMAACLMLALAGGLAADDLLLPGMDTADRASIEAPRDAAVRTLYAERIVLRGPDCTIRLDATRVSPCVQIYSHRTGQTATMAVGLDGRAVIGIQVPGREGLVTALYADGRQGCFQLADQYGRHAINGAQLTAKGWR